MNLLGQLASYSCTNTSLTFDFSSELTHPVKSPQNSNKVASEQFSQILNQKKQKSISIVSLVKQHQKILNQTNIAFPEKHLQQYKDRVTKINQMISILTTKQRKLKYEFLVHLERNIEIKKNNKQTIFLKDALSKSSKQQIQKLQMKTNQKNQLSNVEQITYKINNLRNKIINFVFKRIKSISHLVQKAEILIQILKNIYVRQKKQKQQIFLNKLKLRSSIAKKTTCVHQGINQPIFLKGVPSVKFLTPIQMKSFSNVISAENTPSLYPQNSLSQNIDYYDYLGVFYDPVLVQKSIFFDRNQPKSNKDFHQIKYIKEKQEIEQSSLPMTAFTKRKISDFTLSISDNRQDINFSQIQILDKLKQRRNFIKSNINLLEYPQFSQNFYQNLDQKREEKYDDFLGQFQFEKPSNRYSMNQQRIIRSSSQAKTTHRVTYSQYHLIDKEYEEQMRKYKTFKNYLQKRRESTMEQISKNQQILKKLINKLEKSKLKAEKLKIVIKPKRKEDKNATSCQKTSFQSKQPSHPKDKLSLTKQMKQQQLKKIKRANEIEINKQKMSRNSTPNKKSQNLALKQNSQNKNSYSSTKKQIKDKKSSAQSALMLISRFPQTEQKRLNLKIDLSKHCPNKRISKKESISHTCSGRKKDKNQFK